MSQLFRALGRFLVGVVVDAKRAWYIEAAVTGI